jgi:hypothetical protein
LVEQDVEQFSLPITTYTRSYFLTARMAAPEMANVAVVLAADQASGMTGTVVNLSMGSLDD